MCVLPCIPTASRSLFLFQLSDHNTCVHVYLHVYIQGRTVSPNPSTCFQFVLSYTCYTYYTCYTEDVRFVETL